MIFSVLRVVFVLRDMYREVGGLIEMINKYVLFYLIIIGFDCVLIEIIIL